MYLVLVLGTLQTRTWNPWRPAFYRRWKKKQWTQQRRPAILRQWETKADAADPLPAEVGTPAACQPAASLPDMCAE